LLLPCVTVTCRALRSYRHRGILASEVFDDLGNDHIDFDDHINNFSDHTDYHDHNKYYHDCDYVDDYYSDDDYDNRTTDNNDYFYPHWVYIGTTNWIR
jgi:hypothetical protein